MQTKEKNKKGICGACLAIKILTGDTGIVRGYFYNMLKKGWFEYIRMLPYYMVEDFVDDLCNIVSEELCKFYNGMKKIKHLKSFVWTVIKNKSIDEDIRLSRKIELDFNNNDENTKELGNNPFLGVQQSPEASCVAKDLVRKVLKKLTPFERFLVCCIYYEELSNKEVSEIIGVTDNYVGVILFNLRKKTRKLIEEINRNQCSERAGICGCEEEVS